MDELLRLTAEQYRILDGLAENEQVIVRGAAGTGKTLLAVEEGRRRGRAGERVLFCCYSRALAAYVRQAVKDTPDVAVYDLHGLMTSLIDAAGLKYRLPKSPTVEDFIHIYPDLAQEALIRLDRLQEYDVLIIDEAQDLLSKSYLEMFDALLKGGIKDGKWRFFLDPLQDVFLGSDPEQIKRIEAYKPAKFHLNINCRNTSPVAAAGSLLSVVLSPETLPVEGPDVEWHWYRDHEHERREISKCVNRILGEGFKPPEITILSLRPREGSCLREGLVSVPYPLIDTEDALSLPQERAIRYATTANFKGLESKVIILVDVDTLAEADTLFSLYVGASRAIALLIVFIAESQKAAYGIRAGEYAGKLIAKPGEASRL